MDVKWELFGRRVVPTETSGAETWGMRLVERHSPDVLGMHC